MKVSRRRKDACKNQNGEIVEDKTDMIIEIASIHYLYSTDVRYTNDLAPGEYNGYNTRCVRFPHHMSELFSEPLMKLSKKDADVPTVKQRRSINRNEELEKDKTRRTTN